MKQHNKIKRLKARQVDFEVLRERILKDHPEKVDGYHKPGSIKK